MVNGFCYRRPSHISEYHLDVVYVMPLSIHTGGDVATLLATSTVPSKLS